MTDEKWKSKNGHAISSDVTEQITKTPENITYGDVSKAGVSEALVAFKRIKVFCDASTEQIAPFLISLKQKLDADICCVERALAQQQPEAKLLEACKVALGHMTGGMDGDWRDCDPIAFIREAIARAEQKGGV